MFKAQLRFHLSLLIVSVFLVESIVHPALAIQASLGGQVVTTAPGAKAAKATEPTPAEMTEMQRQYSRALIETMKTGYGGRDPAMRDLMSLDLDRVKELAPDFANAPVDADPFFMRSQKWESSNEKVSDFAVMSDERSTEITIPQTGRKLVLDLPLRSLIATNEYLFFTLHPKSDLFDRLSGVQNSEGEGLFVIETTLLAVHAQRGTPVPVHFLPIMGNGWRTNMTAMQIVQGDILAVSNGTEVIPFLMKDIREMIQVSKINLDISMMISLTKLGSDGKVASERMMPAPGSTAFLGLLVTGLDQTRPGYNFFRDLKSQASFGKPSHLQKYSVIAALLGLNVAHAAAGDADPVTSALLKSATFIGIVGVTIVTAFALKYKSKGIRQRLDAIEKYRRALDPEKVGAEKMKGLREFLRIEGSILASIAQFPLITPGIATQYFVDRHMPSLGAGEHTLMRKVLNQTIYPNLRHFGNISVNDKVTVLGAGYAATFSIGLGYAHSFWMLPAFVSWLSPLVPQGLGFGMAEAFTSTNRESQALLVTNMLVNASIGMLRGPADLTMDAKSQVVEELYARVDNDLRREGLNPDDPKLKSRREEMREALIDLTLIQKGLPTSPEKLFDAMNLYMVVNAARGFATPTNDVLLANINPLSTDIPYEMNEDGTKKLGPDGKPVIQESDFILTSRRGLLPNVLSRALVQAKQWNQLAPTSETAEAQRLVEVMISDSERLRTVLPKAAQALLRQAELQKLQPESRDAAKLKSEIAKLHEEIRSISARALAFRQLLVMANYEGPVEYVARYMPAMWAQRFGSGATGMAVLYLRQGLASYLDGGTVDHLAARREDIFNYQIRAQSEAIVEMKKLKPSLESMSEAAVMANASLRTEVLQRSNIIVKKYGDEQRAEEAAGRYVHKAGWVENWRHRSVLQKAEARLAQYALANAGNPELLSKEALDKSLRDFYLSESAKQIGLHIDGLAPGDRQRTEGNVPWQSDNARYQTMMAEIQEKTALLASKQFESLNVKTYMARLSPRDAANLRLQLEASIFLDTYRNATTMTDAVSPVDPATPGMTQRARQALARQTAKDLQILQDREAERTNAVDRKLLQIRRSVVSIAASTANRGLRFVDGMFNDLSVDRGALGIVSRRVPFAEEFVNANMRNLKLLPVGLTVSWVWSHFALGTGIGYSFWTTAFIFQGVFAMIPVMWMFRNFRMQGFKPYDSDKPGWAGTLHLGGKYGFTEALSATLSFFVIMPAVMFHSNLGQQLTKFVGEPVTQAMQSVTPTEAAAYVMGSVLAYLAGSKLYEKWRMKMTMGRLRSFDQVGKPSPEEQVRLRPSAVGPACEMLFSPAQ